MYHLSSAGSGAESCSSHSISSSTQAVSLHKASFTQSPIAYNQSGDAHAKGLCVKHSSFMCETYAACILQGKWGEDLYSPVPRPMFLIRLVIVAGQLMYDPPLDTIEQAVLEAFDAIVLRSANIDEITTKVSLGAECAVSLMHQPTHHALHVPPCFGSTRMHVCSICGAHELTHLLFEVSHQ